MTELSTNSGVKDANHFINKVTNFSVPVNSVLVTVDVRLLYMSIPNNKASAATTKIITTFLALILALNNFVFNSIFYLQIKGCAISTICAPVFANIFMDKFEQKYIYPLIKDKLIVLLFLDQIRKTKKIYE